MSRTLLRLGVTALSTAALSAVALVPSPALAGSMFFSKDSGTIATTNWLEVGPLPGGILGDAHFGDLYVEDLGRGRASAWGTVYDVECADGVTPYLPDSHGEVPADEAGCELVATRFIDGGQLTFTIDRKLTTARLTGSLAVHSGHGEGPVGAPAVDIRWTGVGATSSTVTTERFTDETGSYNHRYTFTGRSATIATGSRIGPMIFDDETGESSDASIGAYRSVTRGRG